VSELVQVSGDGRAALLRPSRPEARNPLSPEPMERLAAGADIEAMAERRLDEPALVTEDRVEWMRAFLEKREPRFSGR
jgi:hypothetical protein